MVESRRTRQGHHLHRRRGFSGSLSPLCGVGAVRVAWSDAASCMGRMGMRPSVRAASVPSDRLLRAFINSYIVY